MLGLWSIESNAQSSGNNTFTAGWYLGWSSSNALPFKINGTQLMTLGTAGDLNLNTSTSSYQIGGNKVLWHDGTTSDIFVGVGAGNATMSGHENTFVGNNAGNLCATTIGQNTGVGYNSLLNTSAYGGCALGWEASKANTTGCGTVAIGESALRFNTTGNYNIAIGNIALYNNTAMAYNVAVGSYALETQSFGTAVNSYNVAVGFKALHANQPTLTTNGIYNTGIGGNALFSNTTGTGNVGLGYGAGYTNISGIANTCVGYAAGYLNTDSYGTFIGYAAGESNATGDFNTFVGYLAGQDNTIGNSNTFIGLDAGYNNISSSNNTSVGVQALGQTSGTSGTGNNTSLGYKAGWTNQGGTNNTFVGYLADASGATLTNAAAFGNSAQVCADNTMRFGNTSVIRWGFGVCAATGHAIEVGSTSANGNGAYLTSGGVWTDVPSSRNRKDQITQLDKNDILNKVVQLEVPRWRIKGTESEYHIGPMADQFYGFFKVGTESTISAMDKTGVLFLAVQALDEKNRALEAKLTALQEQVKTQGKNSERNATDVTLASGSIVLDQNQPNPFKEQTTITYFIPEDSKDVKIIFTDSRGTVLKEVEIAQTGNGQLNVYAQDLSSGIYTYTLIADGVTIDSKKMVCNK